jgi:hypothetical protein
MDGSPDPAREIVPVPTGLTDEEDAQRYLRLQFDDTIGFCQNCEGTYTMERAVYEDDTREIMATSCPRCGQRDWLVRAGTKPLRKKHT